MFLLAQLFAQPTQLSELKVCLPISRFVRPLVSQSTKVSPKSEILPFGALFVGCVHGLLIPRFEINKIREIFREINSE